MLGKGLVLGFSHVSVQPDAMEFRAKIGVGEIEDTRPILRHRPQRLDAVPVLEYRTQQSEPLEHRQPDRL